VVSPVNVVIWDTVVKVNCLENGSTHLDAMATHSVAKLQIDATILSYVIQLLSRRETVDLEFHTNK